MQKFQNYFEIMRTESTISHSLPPFTLLYISLCLSTIIFLLTPFAKSAPETNDVGETRFLVINKYSGRGRSSLSSSKVHFLYQI